MLCKVYPRQSADRRRNRRRNDHNCVRWCNLGNWCKLRSSNHSYPRVHGTRNAGNVGSSKSRARTGRRFYRRCWDGTCSGRSRRRKNCRERRRRRSRKGCIPPDRIRTFPARNDRNVCRPRSACTGTSRRSSHTEDCESPLDYIRKLKVNIVFLCECEIERKGLNDMKLKCIIED